MVRKPRKAPHPLLLQAIRGLAGVCDGARTQDDVGFNGRHTEIGRDLARQDLWTYKQMLWAHNALATYQNTQLPAMGIRYQDIPKPEPFDDDAVVTPDRMPPIRFGADKSGSDAFLISLDFRHPDFYSLKGEIKQISGRRWWGEEKLWTIAATAPAARKLVELTEANRALPWDPQAKEIADGLIDRADAVRQASRSEDAELDMGDLIPDDLDPHPFQRAGVRFVQAVRRVIIGDEMGLGKTIQAICSLLLLDAFPALIVCPASVKLNWVRECAKWMAKRGPRIQHLSGQQDTVAPDADVVVVNYDLLVGKRRKDPATGKFIKDPKTKKAQLFPVPALESVLQREWRGLVLDESHYAKNPKAQRTQNCMQLAALVPDDGVVMLLSGTPLKNRPVELITQLRILGVFQGLFGSWKHYVTRYCSAFQKYIGRGKYAWDTSGASNLDELQHTLRESCMIRRLKRDVQKELPAKVRSPLYVELSNQDEYEAAKEDVVRYFADRAAADREFLESIEHLDAEAKKAAIRERKQGAEERARQAEELVRLNLLRQVAGRGKLQGAISWIQDFLDGTGDGKLLVFAHHRDVQAGLYEAFRDQAVHLFGSDDVNARQSAIQQFVDDPDTRVFVASIGAGGTGVDGLQRVATNVAFLEFAWTPGDMQQAEDRLHRIGQEGDSVNVWHVTAQGTIDEYFQAMLAAKQEVLERALDAGDEQTAARVRSESVFDAVKQRLMEDAREGVLVF